MNSIAELLVSASAADRERREPWRNHALEARLCCGIAVGRYGAGQRRREQRRAYRAAITGPGLRVLSTAAIEGRGNRLPYAARGMTDAQLLAAVRAGRFTARELA